MIIRLNIKDKKINAVCKIKVSSEKLSFKLARSLQVTKVFFQGEGDLVINSYETTEEFLPELMAYEIKMPKTGCLEIHYQGELEGNLLYMNDKVIHFSFYNAWYPMIDNYFDYEVYIEGFNDSWNLVHGNYDEESKTWHYQTRKTGDNLIDVNILLVNRKHYSIKQSEEIEFYYEDTYRDIIEKYVSVYEQIKSFYINLYGKNRLGHTTYVYLPEDERWKGNGYKRDNLVVSTASPTELDGQIVLMAHELGHGYGNGANVYSFEDWINETNAEWSALLFLSKYYPDLFIKRIKAHKKRMKGHNLNLKQDGENRPSNVHSVGTLIYYDIYEKYGVKDIEDMLIICDELEEKTTFNFIEALKEQKKSHLVDELNEYL